MSKTTNFELDKLSRSDGYAISQFNDNMDIIDTEMAKPPLTVNDISPDAERNIEITTVPLADNLTSDEAQINTGEYIIRTSGGEASISNGAAWLSDIKGNMVKTGEVQEVTEMTVTPIDPDSGTAISATIDWDDFKTVVTSSNTLTFTYTTEWNADPSTYGITVSGTPAAGDQIVVVYVKGNRGTITTANPSSFIATGWNLYNNAVGYARVVKYSDEYGFMIDGTYTGIKFASTLTGAQTTISPVNGYFTVPSDGYVFVTGGNATDTAIWMTWSDWTEEANGGVFEAYSQTSVDLSGVMVNFPYGLMRIDNVYDEINTNTGKAYSRIQRLEYTAENLSTVIASGVPYDTDTGYIYAVRSVAVEYSISVDGEYTVNDHGTEMFSGTTVAVIASSLYGNDLKGKLRRDVLTISEQTLTAAQQAQVFNNLGLRFFRVGQSMYGKTLTDLVADINGYDNGIIVYFAGYSIIRSLSGNSATTTNGCVIVTKINATTAVYSAYNGVVTATGSINLSNGTVTVGETSDYPSVTNQSSTVTDVSVATSTDTEIKAISLTKGDYIIILSAVWASNATGRRNIWASESSAGTRINYACDVNMMAVNGAATRQQLTFFYKATADKTIHFCAFQNSGSSLTLTPRYSIIKLK